MFVCCVQLSFHQHNIPHVFNGGAHFFHGRTNGRAEGTDRGAYGRAHCAYRGAHRRAHRSDRGTDGRPHGPHARTDGIYDVARKETGTVGAGRVCQGGPAAAARLGPSGTSALFRRRFVEQSRTKIRQIDGGATFRMKFAKKESY